jgi:ABC-type transport system involved in multi-copper enzyme maturation permease subunit
MPIYAPTLPPRPALDQGPHPIATIMRFDLKRVLRAKLGRFFGFIFVFILIIRVAVLYVQHLLDSKQQLAQVRDFAKDFLSQGAAFQADCLPPWLLTILWFQVAMVGGGLVSRDTLYRVRPLIYAHPVRPQDYLAAKGLFATALPFAIQLPFVLVPWGLSLLIAGMKGPMWPTAPLHLLPAALVIAGLMGAVTLGASAMATTPRMGFGWVLGIVLGSAALSSLVAGLTGTFAWMALSPGFLVTAWPELLCGVADPRLGWLPASLGTLGHMALWLWIAARRTRPDEAVM